MSHLLDNPVFRFIGHSYQRLRDRVALRKRRLEFCCGDCERSGSCGLPPDDECIARARQIERDGERRRRTPLPIPY
jgi:hypothetical protein